MKKLDQAIEDLICFTLDLTSLSEQSYREGQGMRPILNKDKDSFYEMLYCRTIFFIDWILGGETDNIPYEIKYDLQLFQDAHQTFVNLMKTHGWTQGPENFSKKIHPDIVPWNRLPRKIRAKYLFIYRVTILNLDFYYKIKESAGSYIPNDDPHIFKEDPENCTNH